MILRFIACAFLLIGCTAAVRGAEAPVSPDVVVRDATDKVLKMVQDPALQGEEKSAARQDAMIKVVDQVFDWDLMARLAMGKYWRGLKPEQQQEFVPVFKELIVSAYLSHVEGYQGEKLVYEAAEVDRENGRAEVKVVVTTEAYGDVDILYKLYLNENEWRVRDVSVLGVSLIRNYRTQLNQLMSRDRFGEVIQRLREKVEEQRKSGGVKLK